jgi:hypothetical protein
MERTILILRRMFGHPTGALGRLRPQAGMWVASLTVIAALSQPCGHVGHHSLRLSATWVTEDQRSHVDRLVSPPCVSDPIGICDNGVGV